MPRILLELEPAVYDAIWGHLAAPEREVEEAAFVFASHLEDGDRRFRAIEWYAVPPDGFARQSSFYLELTDETRAHVIKRAHDLGASLVELHSHVGPHPAAFSLSDLAGFEEFVPHVWWRLKGKPYVAVVATDSGFDGLAWVSDPLTPVRIDGISVAGSVLEPSRLSRFTPDSYGEW
jgi:hypothetical protein